MADLSLIQSSGSTIIVGSDATGQEQTPIQSTTSGALQVNQAGVVSTQNSTTSLLAANAVFTGTAEEVTDYSTISIQLFADQASASLGFKPQYSPDATNWDDGDAYSIIAQTAGNGKFFTFPPQARFFRLVYTNGPTVQTMFRIQTILHRVEIKNSSHRIADVLDTENDAELVKAIITGQRVDGTFDSVKQTNTNELRVVDISDAGGTQAAITVGTTAVLVNATGTNLANRTMVTVFNNSAVTIYWGYTSAVTTATGTPLFAGQERGFAIGPNTNLYTIAATAANNARITERA